MMSDAGGKLYVCIKYNNKKWICSVSLLIFLLFSCHIYEDGEYSVSIK